jgi:hypothetical protein
MTRIGEAPMTILRRPGGKEHARRVFDYDKDAEYDDRKAQTFRVISVEPPM